MLSLSSLSSLNTDIVQESEIYVSQARSTNCIWTIWQDLLWWLARSCFLLELGLSRTMAHYWSGSVSVPCNLQCCVSRYLWALLVSSSPHYPTMKTQVLRLWVLFISVFYGFYGFKQCIYINIYEYGMGLLGWSY